MSTHGPFFPQQKSLLFFTLSHPYFAATLSQEEQGMLQELNRLSNRLDAHYKLSKTILKAEIKKTEQILRYFQERGLRTFKVGDMKGYVVSQQKDENHRLPVFKALTQNATPGLAGSPENGSRPAPVLTNFHHHRSTKENYTPTVTQTESAAQGRLTLIRSC